MAAPSENAGLPRFRVPAGKGGGICRRLLLAWLPETRHPAAGQPALLETQAYQKRVAGPGGQSIIAKIRVAGGAGVGT